MCVPAWSVSNEQLKELGHYVDPPWAAKTLNIKSRHICVEETTRSLALNAAAKAIIEAKATEIDLIIVGTTTPDKRAPATACYIQDALGLNGPPAFDMTAVCASFIYALVASCEMMESKRYRNILVVGADTLSKYTDWGDRNCVFFGDGAGAVVLSNGRGILATHWASDGSGAEAWTIEKDNFWHMKGKWVYQLAVEHIYASATECLRRANLTADDIDLVIPHQPGIGVLKDAAKALGIPFEKIHTVMDRYANTSSACIPIALNDALDKQRIVEGDKILLTGVGAGWTSASVVMEW